MKDMDETIVSTISIHLKSGNILICQVPFKYDSAEFMKLTSKKLDGFVGIYARNEQEVALLNGFSEIGFKPEEVEYFKIKYQNKLEVLKNLGSD